MLRTRSIDEAATVPTRACWWWATAAVAVLFAVGCGAGPLEAAKAGRPASAASSTSSPSPTNSAVLATFDVGGDGWAMVATAHHLWIQVDDPVDSIVRLDKRTGEAVPMVPHGHRPVTGPDGLWVIGSDWVVKVDPNDGKQSRRVGHGGSFTIAQGRGWLRTPDGVVYRVNLKTGKLGEVATVDPALCGSPKDIAMAFGMVWLACKEGHVVEVPLDGQKPRVIATGLGSHTFAVTEDALWVTNYMDGTISRINPRTHQASVIKEVGSGIGITTGGGYVWSSDSQGIAKIDPRTGNIVDHLAVAPGSYYELVWDDGVIWASTREAKVLKLNATS